MKKELSQKEREETVTKGFLFDCFEERDYVTKDYLKEALLEQSEDFHRRVSAVLEEHRAYLGALIENLDNRYVLRREWRAQGGV